MAENLKVDNVDLKILEILMQDAKKPYTEVAKKAFVSGGTVHVRMNKLEEAGIVEKTTLKVNYAKLGYDITAFIGIFLQKSALYDQVMATSKTIPEITNIHYTTGNYSITYNDGASRDRGKYLLVLRNTAGNWRVEKTIWSSDLPVPAGMRISATIMRSPTARMISPSRKQWPRHTMPSSRSVS